MKQETRIIPCVCTPHPPTCADRVSYGMPVLTAWNSNSPKHRYFWDIKCPVCGRGGLMEVSSSAAAIKHWNRLMTNAYKETQREILYYDDFEKYMDKNGNVLPQYRSQWDKI